MQRAKSQNASSTVAWMGVIGFFISSATGLFTIYDQVYRQPSEEQEKRVLRFETAVQQIQSINQSAGSISTGSTAPTQAAAMLAKGALVATAMGLLPRVRSRVSYSEYATLVNEQLNLGNMEKALELADAALKVADGELQRNEGLRGQAYVEFISGKPKYARDHLQMAIATVRARPLGVTRAYTLATWALYEAAFGECSRIDDLLASFEREAIAEQPEVRSTQEQQLRSGLDYQHRCPWNRDRLPAASVPMGQTLAPNSN